MASEAAPLKGFAGARGDASKRPANWKVWLQWSRVLCAASVCRTLLTLVPYSDVALSVCCGRVRPAQAASAMGFPAPTYESDEVRKEVQRGFLRKVYGILCAQLLCTVATCWAVMAHPGSFRRSVYGFWSVRF